MNKKIVNALLAVILVGCAASQKPAEKKDNKLGLNENTSVTLCGDPGFIVKNCTYQLPTGDWMTGGINMSGMTAFLKNPVCVADECNQWCWGPFGEICCGTDSKAQPRSPSTYSAFVRHPSDKKNPLGAWHLWCSTNADHASITHLHVRSVSQPL